MHSFGSVGLGMIIGFVITFMYGSTMTMTHYVLAGIGVVVLLTDNRAVDWIYRKVASKEPEQ